MIRFECDYAEGAHPRILAKMAQTNGEQTPGYGEDAHCACARAQIQALCENPAADVHFLVGGTQANLTVIAAALRPWQGVIAAETGHINVHESGAIEATGHKVLTVPGVEGKVTAAQVRALCMAHWQDTSHEHMVQPGMVYVSHPTEIGTLYTKAELTALSDACKACGLTLYLDGARLGYGLAADGADLTIADIARLCDVFYIGGTKVGALFGEAVVILQPTLKQDFRYLIKQRGGMLAKGRLLGIQFETLLQDGLYFEISARAVQLAMQIRHACEGKGYPFLVDSHTNQQFPILPNAEIQKLSKKYSFSIWQAMDAEHTAIRLCTSWATQAAHVEALIEDIQGL
ncbi:MAG: beta-eliminating lyase-related protein [Clostridia bacterium]